MVIYMTATFLPISHRTFSLALTVLLNCCSPQVENCRYLIASNKAVPLSDLSLLVLSRALGSRHRELAQAGEIKEETGSTSLCGPLLKLLASMISVLAGESTKGDTILLQQTTDSIR
jgi:hypothetical protein